VVFNALIFMYVSHWVDFHKTGAWSTTFSIEFFIPDFTKIQWTVQLLITWSEDRWTNMVYMQGILFRHICKIAKCNY
jgi:hypothetical protein